VTRYFSCPVKSCDIIHSFSMSTDISQFDYDLPDNFIAQSPAEPRETGKLMSISKMTGIIKHLHILDFPSLLLPTDILVINNTKVFKARLHGTLNNQHHSSVEIFLIHPVSESDTVWLAIGKPGKKLLDNTTVTIGPNFIATILSKNSDGTIHVSFGKTTHDVLNLADMYGSIPLPPYIKHPKNPESYQTSYAKVVGSVAAPTAGFHITPKLLETMKMKGVTICEITLHVGLGTFKPVKTKTIEEHVMHSEWVSVSDTTARTINDAKRKGRRVIAVGTTTVRTLEGVAALHNGRLEAFAGDINIFITPGFRFSIIDGFLTNFHLPKSTLLILVSAFAGRERILHAYKEAIKHSYRFYSFGDAMFIS
jgi:S-adenosylmethionine:tRNA ribosyltransferase-isomerase